MTAESKGYQAAKWHHYDTYRCNYCSFSVMDEGAMVTHIKNYHSNMETVRPAEVGGDQARDTNESQTQTGKEHTTEPDEGESLSDRVNEREEGEGRYPNPFR